MSYTLRPSASGDTLASSRDPIRTNFSLIQQQFEQNHVSIQSDGKHKFLQMPQQGSIPDVAASEIGLYAYSDGSVTQLFLKGANTGSSYQLSYATSGVDPDIASFGTVAGVSSSGWSFLPGGLLMQYGNATSSGTSLPNTTVTFPKSFGTGLYSVTATILTTSDSRFFVEIYDSSTSQFRAVTRDSGGSKTSGLVFYWMAIGK